MTWPIGAGTSSGRPTTPARAPDATTAAPSMVWRSARSHFHRQVERYRNDPSHREPDFQALADAYYHAQGELHHMDWHVQDDLRDVEGHIHTLMDYYGRRATGTAGIAAIESHWEAARAIQRSRDRLAQRQCWGWT